MRNSVCNFSWKPASGDKYQIDQILIEQYKLCMFRAFCDVIPTGDVPSCTWSPIGGFITGVSPHMPPVTRAHTHVDKVIHGLHVFSDELFMR